MENPDKLITNLSAYELSSNELEIVKLGLRYDVVTPPVESVIFGRHLGSNQKCESYQKWLIRTAD